MNPRAMPPSLTHSFMTTPTPRALLKSTLRLAALVLAIIAGTSPATAAAADASAPLPVSAFFRDSDTSEAVLSPSGRWVAITAAHGGGRRRLIVVDLTGANKPVVVASFGDADVTTPQWVNDQQVLFKTIDTHRGLGDQKFGPGLFVVNSDGVALTMLITGGDAPSTTGTNIHSQLPLSVEHALLFVPPAGGTDIVVGKWVFDQQGNTVGINALRVNVVTHRVMSMSQDRPEHAMQWLFDPHGEPRAIVATNAGRSTVWWHAPGKTDWTSVAEFPMLRTAFTPVYVDGSAQLYVTAPTGERGTDVLTRFDFAKGRAEPQPIVATPGFDVGGDIVTDDSGARMIGMRIDTDAAATIWFDQDMKDFQALVDAKFPGRVNVVTCRKCNSTGAALVYSYSDQEPGTWLAYRAADKTWQQLGRVHDDIDPRRMAQLDFHRIAARDGEDLPVWVTTPRRAKDAPRPPAIVLVHGGPWVRGTSWEWNAEAQFLASRGYVVIEPEYRGSEGFGSLHQHAGDKQWGGKMQDDVADAARWAATQGLVDPKRICIAGASYGGYAALMGPIRYPDLYRCAVAWVAVTDPRFMYEETWTNDSNVEWQHFGLPDTVGDLDKDRAMLAAAAPVEHASDIHVPVLLAFAGADRRVPIKHGTEMRAAMHAAGNDPEWIVYPDEAHGFLQVDTNLDFWNRVEAFLAKNDR